VEALSRTFVPPSGEQFGATGSILVWKGKDASVRRAGSPRVNHSRSGRHVMSKPVAVVTVMPWL
jgi:hypothetical protein